MPWPVVVIGGGWAGLAAALHLCGAGRRVTLLEGSRGLGGRARSVQLEDHTVDNGQHLLLGSCTAVLQVLKRAGVSESQAFQRAPFFLYMRGRNGQRVEFRTPKLPAPLNLGAAILACRGLPLATRLQGVWRAGALLANDSTPSMDLTVSQWLAQSLQPPALRQWFWEPLCLAALNTPPSEASASLLATLLREVLNSRRQGSDLLFPRNNLSALYSEPVGQRIGATGGSIELGCRVVAVEAAGGQVTAVRTRKGRIECKQVVLATGPAGAGKLLESAGEFQAAARTAQLEEKPITTVYLQYPNQVRLEHPFVGLVGLRTQWLFDRRLPGQQGIIAAVISSDTAAHGLRNSEAGRLVAEEVAMLYPRWPKPVRIRAIRERRATFAATPLSEPLRQPVHTATLGLWVAGDYTRTGLPGTLEGAVRSGLECARAILSSSSDSRDSNATE